MAEKILQPVINWAEQETLHKSEVGSAGILRERLKRPDGSCITLTTVTATESSQYSLLLDPRFEELGIVTEPGGLLIDPIATKKLWKEQTPGIEPGKFLSFESVSIDSIGVPPSNSFWQLGGYFIRDGKITKMPNDESLSGKYETLVFNPDLGWYAKDLELIDGEILHNQLDGIKIGLNMPLIIRNGLIVPQNEIAGRGDLRALADLRNFYDFSAGKSSQEVFNFRFFDLVRKFQPTDAAEVTQMIAGTEVIYKVNSEASLVNEFNNIVKETGLNDHWSVKVASDNKAEVKMKGPFPPNQTPLVGVGHNDKGNLFITVIDGRQKSSTGATFDELSNIMMNKGAVNAGIGAAGGDAVVVAKTKDEIKILSSPSNRNKDENRITRPVPSLLILS